MEIEDDYHKRVLQFENTSHIYLFGKLIEHGHELERLKVSEANMKKK